MTTRPMRQMCPPHEEGGRRQTLGCGLCGMPAVGRPTPRGRVLDELDRIPFRIEERRKPRVAFDVSFMNEADASGRELGLRQVEVTDGEHGRGSTAADRLAVSR